MLPGILKSLEGFLIEELNYPVIKLINCHK